MVFLIFLLSLFFAPSLFAAPQISIVDYSNSVTPDSIFPVSFLVTNTNIGTTYYYKFFGGIGDSTSSIKTNSNLSYNSAWSNFPTFVTDLGGSALINSTAYIIPDVLAENYNLKIKIALTSNTNNGVTSPSFPLIVFIPTATPSPFVSPEPTAEVDLILSEIMANPDTGQDEWLEIYNPSSESISLKNLCFYDQSKNSRCLSEDVSISPFSYFTHSFSSGFLNNDGDTVTFLNTSITYPKSAKNISYSLQKDNTWCFTEISQDKDNNSCTINNSSNSNSDSGEKYPLPQLNLEFVPDSVAAGDDFNLVFSLKSSDLFSLRLIFPFTTQYFPFSNFKDGYSWLTLPLSVLKNYPPAPILYLFI